MQLFPALKNPQIIQILADLQKAKEQDVETHLECAVAAIGGTYHPARPLEKMVLLLVEDDPLVAQILQKEASAEPSGNPCGGLLKRSESRFGAKRSFP